EAAADDDHVGGDVLGQRRARGFLPRGERLAQPPAALQSRVQRIGLEIESLHGHGAQFRCARLKVVAPSTVAALLAHGASEHQALVVPGRLSFSYARLRELTDEAAHSLVAYGIGAGDRVAMVLPNSAAPKPSGAGAAGLVLHTSGTTSRPKRVPLLHANLTASVANIIATYELTPDDASLCVMPLFHVHGLVASALATFGSGGTVIAPDHFSPLGFWPLMQTAKPTWFTASPTP